MNCRCPDSDDASSVARDPLAFWVQLRLSAGQGRESTDLDGAIWEYGPGRFDLWRLKSVDGISRGIWPKAGR